MATRIRKNILSFWLIYWAVKIKRIIWNKYILDWLKAFWIIFVVVSDDPHPALDVDCWALSQMNRQEKIKYFNKILRRRCLIQKCRLFL